jgi:YD repeat-containing protein
MKNFGVPLLALCVFSVFLFPGCEKESAVIKQGNTDYLISKIFKEGKIYQEYIYNESKKLIRVNYYYDDSVYNFEAYKYNIIGQVIKKEYSDYYYDTYEYDQAGRFIKLNTHYNDSEIYSVTEFIYNTQGQIEKGIVTARERDSWDIVYTYDSRGNVITRIEGEDEESMFARTSSEYEYDDKNNPRYNWGLPTDIIQYNNPVRYHNENMISCAMPPDFEYQYEYNSDGYPVIEIRNWVWSEVHDTFYYEYLK